MNVGGGKHWRIWQIDPDLPKFYLPKFYHPYSSLTEFELKCQDSINVSRGSSLIVDIHQLNSSLTYSDQFFQFLSKRNEEKWKKAVWPCKLTDAFCQYMQANLHWNSYTSI